MLRKRADDGRSDPLRVAVEAGADAFVVVDADGRILEWNRQAARLFGYTREQVLGQELTLFSPSNGATQQPMPRIAEDGDGVVARRIAMPAVDRRGRSVPVELTVWPAQWGDTKCYGGLFRVLDQPPAEQLFCRVGSIVESSDAAITSQGLDGRILTWNKAAEEIYGFTEGEVIGQPASIIVPLDRLDEVDRFFDAVRRGEAVANHETVRLRKDGSTVDVAVTISPVYDTSGRVVGISTIARDITEQRQMAAALEQALTDAREAEARTRRFLADAAHQLRNPLAAVRAVADSLLRTSSVAGRERLLAHIIDDAARAGRLVDGLLRIARLDAGEAPQPQATDVVALAEAEVRRVRLLAPNLEVGLVGDEGVDEKFIVDADMVREILANVLDNARRYARSRIDVSVRRRDKWLVIGIRDDGPGLAPEKSVRAFERFTTLDAKGGSGLGLPIARDLARAHGGDLSYEDAEFALSLPAVAAKPAAD